MSTNSHTRRFFVSDLSSDEVHVHPSEVHHALHVVRLKDGDEVELFDGSGHVAVGVIGHISRKNVVVRITTRQPRQTAERPLIHLAFGSPKGKRLDWLVEKATELGAASLQRVIFERSSPNAKTESTAKSDKLLAHCISAAKQSGVNFLPELPAPVTLAELLSARDDSPGFLGDIAPAARGLSEAIGSKLPCESITLLIGPEGGLSENERNESIASGFIPVRIARTTLRTETASIALLGATVALLPLK
ncbi:MAG: 16S rRNA (uracil(1498)-N(3))-methyltransferase [bacterium]|nr:16S rRNA (uracil(1498)-N(3))-methyltransferase [bacterium]